jgi:hypothetical protein
MWLLNSKPKLNVREKLYLHATNLKICWVFNILLTAKLKPSGVGVRMVEKMEPATYFVVKCHELFQMILVGF